jgi:hypothetical protein
LEAVLNGVFCFLGWFGFADWLCSLFQIVGGQKLNIKESSKTQENRVWAGSSAGMNA